MKNKVLAIAMACVLVLCTVIGGTLAWLTDRTPEINNTFTVGDINIDLTETGAAAGQTDGVLDKAYDFVPGDTLDKDPKVTVAANSEDCFVFVKVVETKNNIADVHANDIIVWSVDSGWTALAGQDGIWYRKVTKSTAPQEFAVLTGNKVTVSEDVTKEMVDTLKTNKPTLQFKAAAVQVKNLADKSTDDAVNAAAAYAKVVW